MQHYDPSAVANEMSKIFVYQNEKAWVKTINYIDELPSNYALNKKTKTEYITRFQRDVYRYIAFKNGKNVI